MKAIGGIIIIIIIAGLGWWALSGKETNSGSTTPAKSESTTEKTAVTPGTYTVDPLKSLVGWSAKKPLIEGYINSGSIAVASGTIMTTESKATGDFTIDMNTLVVGLTATKPGKEGALEKHLKSDDFFDVAKYPTAFFEILEVTPTETSAADFTYMVRGKLTMKGKTNEISFPAHIFMNEGNLEAHATFEIDRTKWGLTYGSGNFFQGLGDKLIADQVALTLTIVAAPESAGTNI